MYVVIYDNPVPSLRRDSFEGVTTKIYEPYIGL